MNRSVMRQCALLVVLCVVSLVDGRPRNKRDYPPDNQTDWFQQARDHLERARNLKPINKVAKNVILCIGDAMGLPNTAVSRIYKAQYDTFKDEPSKWGKSVETWFSFENMPYASIIRTYSSSSQVGASSEGATAMMCGSKVNRGTIGVNANVKRWKDNQNFEDTCGQHLDNNGLSSIASWFQNDNRSAGFVTNTRVTHATPGSVFGQSAERGWEYKSEYPECKDLGRQLVEDAPGKHLKVIMGGGRRSLLANTMDDPEEAGKKGKRIDGKNLIQEWETVHADSDAYYVWNKTAFENVPDDADFLLGLFANSHMQYELNRAGDVGGEPSLAEMTEKAINILSQNDKGYFLMIEGGRIDHGHHENYARLAMQDTLAFDDAIAKALEMTDEEETLIIVTGDHSTSVHLVGYPSIGNDILGVDDTRVERIDDGRGDFTSIQYINGPSARLHNETNPPGRQLVANYDTHATYYQQDALVNLQWQTHSGEDVGAYARGPMAHYLHGVHENSYIAHVMAMSACVGDYVNDQDCVDRRDNDQGEDDDEQ